MAMNRHPGITMHKLSFGDGFAGLVFTAGTALIFLFGLPALWYFVAFAFGLAIGIAILLRLVSRSRSDHDRPLSILTSVEKPSTPIHQPRDHQLQLSVKPVSA